MYSCFGPSRGRIHTGKTYEELHEQLKRYQIEGVIHLDSLAGLPRRHRLVAAATRNTSPPVNLFTSKIAIESPETSGGHRKEAKERNKIYSRRKYYRKKIENQVLEEQAATLKELNASLREENVRLEGQLQQALSMVRSIEGHHRN